MSLDGYIDDASDSRLLLSNDADFDRVDEERAASDAILVGANTIRRDDPRLLVRSERRRSERMHRGLSSSPAKVTVTQSGRIDPNRKFFTEGDADVLRIVYCASSSVAATREHLGTLRAVQVADAGDPPDLATVLVDLGRRGYRRVFIEGGTSILTQTLAKDLADELHLVIAPFFVGGGSSAARFVTDASFPFDSKNRMKLEEATPINGVVLLRYLMPRPPKPHSSNP
jgi:5-amino-6-(5-phosphoribosylamino)uracil reductase